MDECDGYYKCNECDEYNEYGNYNDRIDYDDSTKTNNVNICKYIPTLDKYHVYNLYTKQFAKQCILIPYDASNKAIALATFQVASVEDWPIFHMSYIVLIDRTNRTYMHMENIKLINKWLDIDFVDNSKCIIINNE